MPVDRYAPRQISKQLLIIGEGSADEAFFVNLCAARAVAGFQVIGLKGVEKGTPTGNTGFQEYLNAIKDTTGFDDLKGVVIVADCDDKPQDRFLEIRKQLKKAQYGEPDNPFQIVHSRPGIPAVAVVMVPFTNALGPQKGCLETLILRALRGR